ncbi:MAG: hypothetical protein HYT77_08035 [Deltaproteobacteria bacterium]|nr:hypothetical protein [Deltaproteobacteria bacterium]
MDDFYKSNDKRLDMAKTYGGKLSIEIDTLEDLRNAQELIKNFKDNSEGLTTVELTKQYLIKKGVFKNPKVDFIDIGNINHIYKITSGGKELYLKYYGINPRRTTEAIEMIGYTTSRFENEVEALGFLNKTLDDKYKGAIPKIYFIDYENRVLLMTDIAQNKENLKGALLKEYNLNEIKKPIKELASMVAQQHARSINKKLENTDENFVRRFYNFRTFNSAVNLTQNERELIKKRAEKILKENGEFQCLINADISPKQIFINKDEIGICDFEILSPGVASHDIGFFIGNLRLIEIIKEDKNIGKIIEEFLKTYFNELNIELNENKDRFIEFTKENLKFFIGLGMLNRIDAVPLEEYIPENKVQNIREEAKKLIFNS